MNIAQQIINGSRTLLGNWDASGAATTKPAKTGTVPPATCGVGEVFFNSIANPGANLHLCTSTNTWTQVQGMKHWRRELSPGFHQRDLSNAGA